MSRRCIFKNCTTSSSVSNVVTLFAFPKDRERQKSWLELAGRDDHILQKGDSLCELHFGHQFMSINQRRKVLVGLAVPFPYTNDEIDQNGVSEMEERLTDDLDQILHNEQSEDDPIDGNDYASDTLVEHIEEEYPIESVNVDGESETEGKSMMRIETVNVTSPLPKKIRRLSAQNYKLINCKEERNEKFDEEETGNRPTSPEIIEHPDVSIFHFRGEEFIQMPKKLYLDEKRKLQDRQSNGYKDEISKLRTELEVYKDKFSTIRGLLKGVP